MAAGSAAAPPGANSAAGSGGGGGGSGAGGVGAASGAGSAGGISVGGTGRRLDRRLVLHGLGLHLLHGLRQGRAPVVRELVDRRAAAGQRRSGRGHRGDLLACCELGGGVEALARPDHRLEQVPQRAGAVGRYERGRRHERGHPLRRGAELAQAGAAAQAGAHVRPQGRELLRARLAVGQRGQEPS